MQSSAQAYGRALTVWGQWLRQYRHTRAPRALQTALACREIAAEKLVIWHADLKLIQSAMQAERAERVACTELSLDKIRREIEGDEEVLRATGLAPDTVKIAWPDDVADTDAEDDPNAALGTAQEGVPAYRNVRTAGIAT
jgi:hypothetical protein